MLFLPFGRYSLALRHVIQSNLGSAFVPCQPQYVNYVDQPVIDEKTRLGRSKTSTREGTVIRADASAVRKVNPLRGKTVVPSPPDRGRHTGGPRSQGQRWSTRLPWMVGRFPNYATAWAPAGSNHHRRSPIHAFRLPPPRRRRSVVPWPSPGTRWSWIPANVCALHAEMSALLSARNSGREPSRQLRGQSLRRAGKMFRCNAG